jgi:hypothetical protein
MPKLPDVTSLQRPVPRSQRAIPSDRSGEIEGAAVADFGGNLARIGGDIQQRQDRFAYAQARSELLQADIAIRRELENDQDFATYEQRYREKLGKAREGATAKVQGRMDRALFEQETKLDIERGVSSVREIARRKEVDVGRAGLQQTLANNRTVALETGDEALRTALISSTTDAILGARDKGYINAQEAVDERQRWTADYAEGFLDIKPLPERIKILSEPKGTPADYIAPDRRAVLLKAARNELKAEQDRLKTEARQVLGDQLQDIAAAAQAGIPVKNVPPKAALQLAFGEREGAERYESARKLANMSVEVASLHGLPVEDLIAQAESYRPTQVEGAAEQGPLYAFMSRSVSQILTARQKDPAGYLVENSPAVKEAWAGFSADPQQVEKYFSAIDAEKTRLGMDSPDVLPDAVARGIADEITQSKTAEGTADRIEQEAARWGERWPEVYGQLAPKLPSMTRVIGSGIPRPAAVALASTAQLKQSELGAMLPPSTKWNDVVGLVDDTFGDFRRSLPADRGAVETWNAVRDAAVRLSVKNMSDGADRSEAVQKAYRDLVESQYQLVEFRGMPIRVSGNFDADEIERGVDLAISRFEPDAASLVVPEGATGDSVQYAQDFTRYVQQNGYWVTRPDSLGVRLYADGGPVVTQSGPVEFTWQQLSDLGHEAVLTHEAEERARVLKRQERY